MRPRATKDLAQLPDPELFEEIEKGLRNCLGSSLDAWRAARPLGESRRCRPYNVLKTIADEEASKFLILFDVVRCPRTSDTYFSRQLGYFHDHLAKGIYSECCQMASPEFSTVERFIERERQEFYVDGPNGWDWVFRNEILTKREQNLYVDYVDSSDGHGWQTPLAFVGLGLVYVRMPAPLEVARALRRAGFVSKTALEIIARRWRNIDTAAPSSWQNQRKLNTETLEDLNNAALLRAAPAWVYECIINKWHLPLYRFDLRTSAMRKTSNLNEVKAAQERMFYDDVVGPVSY